MACSLLLVLVQLCCMAVGVWWRLWCWGARLAAQACVWSVLEGRRWVQAKHVVMVRGNVEGVVWY